MMIKNKEELRQHYILPKGRTLKKQLGCLETHSRRFIELSPFFVLASYGADGSVDASPRGGLPGFVKVISEDRLIVPDSKGNNRLDGLTNIVETGRVGMIFMVPGVDETLRINGEAVIRDDSELLDYFKKERNPPKVVIDIEPLEVYLHCAKALMRSKLWSEDAKIDRKILPTMGQMINDQIGLQKPSESQEEMIRRYTLDL